VAGDLRALDGVWFVNRAHTVWIAELSRHRPTYYRAVDAGGGRERFKVLTLRHPLKGQLVDAIDFSPDETFNRTVAGCRCLIYSVTYLPPSPAPRYAAGVALRGGVLATMDELVGPPPANVAPINQFREVVLVCDEACGLQHRARNRQLSSAELLRDFLLEVDSRYTLRIRSAVFEC
jgi:hypothetical protein